MQRIAGLAPTTIKLLIMDIKQNILDAVNEWLTPSFDRRNTRAVKALLQVLRQN
jgi:hypothetical protein